MRRSRPTSIRRARRRRCYPTKAEEGPFASQVLGCKVLWNREVLQGRRWRNHPPRGQGPTLRGVEESRRTVAWQANAPPLAKASACAFRIVDSWSCLRERPPLVELPGCRGASDTRGPHFGTRHTGIGQLGGAAVNVRPGKGRH